MVDAESSDKTSADLAGLKVACQVAQSAVARTRRELFSKRCKFYYYQLRLISIAFGAPPWVAALAVAATTGFLAAMLAIISGGGGAGTSISALAFGFTISGAVTLWLVRDELGE